MTKYSLYDYEIDWYTDLLDQEAQIKWIYTIFKGKERIKESDEWYISEQDAELNVQHYISCYLENGEMP